MLTYDEKKANASTILPEGEYEVMAQDFMHGQSQNGDPMTTFVFVVRTDVEQKGKGRKLFHRMVHNERTETMWARMNKALGVPNGATFDDYEDWASYVVGKPIRAVVKHRETEKGVFANIAYFKPTEAGEVQAEHSPSTVSVPNVDDEDMPF